jgi:hypothetical protein
MIKINRQTGEITGKIDASKAWEKIVEAYVQLPEEEEKENV